MFQGFNGRVPGIGHMGLHRIHAVSRRPGSHPSGDSFVIGVIPSALRIRATDDEVTHRPGARRGDAIGQGFGERSQEYIHNPLRHLHIPARHGRRCSRVDSRAFRGNHGQGNHAPRIGRDVKFDEAAEDIEDRGQRHGIHGIDTASHLRGCPRKIDHGLIPSYGHGHDDLNGFIGHSVIIQVIFKGIATIRDPPDGLSGHPLGVRLELLHGVEGLFRSVAGDDLEESPPPGLVRRQLGLQVPLPLVRSPHVGQQEIENILVQPPLLHECYRWDSNSLLKDFRGHRHGAGGHPSHISMMGAVCDKEEGRGAFFSKDRRDKGYVREMGAPPVRVVEDHRISRADAPSLHRTLHRQGHRPQMNGDMGRLCDHLPPAVKEGAGVIPALLDVGRVSGPTQGNPHLFGDRSKEIFEDLQLDRIVWSLHRDPLRAGAF